MTKLSTVFLLGSGATAGSGVKKGKESLPTDSGFFGSAIVENRLCNYPALKSFREFWKHQKEEGLCKTWQDIFIFRGLASSGVIKEDKDIKNIMESLRKYSESNDDQSVNNQKNHYKHQFKIIDTEKRLNDSQPKPYAYYFAELAIWDLRVLVKEIYSELEYDEKVYKEFYNQIKSLKPIPIFVNFNYDTTFDDYINKSNGISKKPEIIRPHGSLKWTSTNYFSINGNRWCYPWEDSREKELKLSELGYIRNRV